MANGSVYRSYEVREGFGSSEGGPVELETTSRLDADVQAERMSAEGRCAQVFGIKSDGGGSRVLLRSLVGYRVAA